MEVYDCVPSTNDLARSAAREGAPEGVLFVAAAQSAGRGRVGKSFFSPNDTGLYMSVLLRPSLPATDALYITVAAAVATSRAIERISGKRMSIKWVNDLFCGGRKLCGILAEAAFSPDGEALAHAALGIGVNITPPEGGFGELEGIAGALFAEGETVPENIHERLAAEIYNSFFELYGRMDSREVYDEYAARLFVIGRNVAVVRAGERRCARVLELERDYSLSVEYENGERERLQSGEISIISE